MVLAEMICLRQYISETIVYFLNSKADQIYRVNIQSIEILQGFGGILLTFTYSNVNQMRQYIGAVIAERNILSPLCLSAKTSPINLAVASENGNKFYTKMTLSNCK